MIHQLLQLAAGVAGLIFLHALERRLRPPAAPAPSQAAADSGPPKELPMSLNLNALASKVSLPGVSLTQVLTILSKLVSFIVIVEQLGADLKGDAKLATVMAMTENFLESLGIADNIKAVLAELSWVTAFIVKLYNFLKLWPAAPATPQA